MSATKPRDTFDDIPYVVIHEERCLASQRSPEQTKAYRRESIRRMLEGETPRVYEDQCTFDDDADVVDRAPIKVMRPAGATWNPPPPRSIK